MLFGIAGEIRVLNCNKKIRFSPEFLSRFVIPCPYECVDYKRRQLGDDRVSV